VVHLDRDLCTTSPPQAGTMATKNTTKRARKKALIEKENKRKSLLRVRMICGAFVLLGSFGVVHFIFTTLSKSTPPPVVEQVHLNSEIKHKVISYFEANNAAEMIPIIKCESRFRHYDTTGNPLQNTSGSSAVGVAQIMSSLHPDPKVLKRYNLKNDTNHTIDDFDVTTFEGNIEYALVLYKTNGTRDWECANKS